MSSENMPTWGDVSRKVTKILFDFGGLGNLCRLGLLVCTCSATPASHPGSGVRDGGLASKVLHAQECDRTNTNLILRGEFHQKNTQKSSLFRSSKTLLMGQ